MTQVGPWTIPDADESRRIAFQLQRPGWHFTPPWYSRNGRWHALHNGVDLEAATLAELLDEAEDFALLDSLARDLS